MTVLFLASGQEGEARQVASELRARGADVAWFDTAWFPTRASIRAELGRGGWRGTITTPDRTIRLEALTAIYYGHSDGYGFPSSLTEPELRFATVEARFGLGGLLTSLPVRWVSHPSAVADAEYRLRQMAVASACGLAVLESSVTSEESSAKEFCARHPTVYKAIMHKTISEEDLVKMIYTTPVTAAELDDRVSLTPHLFQRNIIEKAHDVRALVTTGGMLAVSIHSENPDAVQDWRTRYDALRYRSCEVPAEIRAGCHAVLATLSLRTGVFDFSVDRQGQWWYLEVNPSGRWAWIAAETGLPMAELIADELTAGEEG